MSDAISAVGSAAVSTIGTVAVVGMASKAIGRATGGMNRRTKRSSKRRSGSRRSSKSMIW